MQSKFIFNLPLSEIDQRLINGMDNVNNNYYRHNKDIIDFLHTCGLKQNHNLIFTKSFDYKIFQGTNYVGLYFINQGKIYISTSVVNIYHEIGHFAESNMIQSKEVDFGLFINQINKKMLEREFVASVYQDKLSTFFTNRSEEKLIDNINHKINIWNSFSKTKLTFDFEAEHFRDLAMSYENVSIDEIIDRIKANINYLKNHNLLM